MVLRNHIATRFLTDDNFALELVEATYPGEWSKLMETEKDEPAWDALLDTVSSFYELVNFRRQKAYYVTNTVLDKLELLKVEKKDNHWNWSVFLDIPEGKRTFIFDNNQLLRIWKDSHGRISFIWMTFVFDQRGVIDGNAKWEMFWVDLKTNYECEHFGSQPIKEIELLIYRLMCFMFLTENDEVTVQPGLKHGTRKSGKLINSLNIPLTIVNSRWNTTIVRDEGFDVSGHYRLQPYGPKMTKNKIIFIQPFSKSGYERKAKSIIIDN